MPSFIEELMGSLGPEVSSQLSSALGLDANTASQILPQVAPMILGGLLGDSGVQAANLLSQNFNLDRNTAMKIIPMLAPIILGFLTQKRDAGGAGSQGIAALIDQNGDGSVLDDVAGFFMRGLGGGQSSQTGGGLLGGLLGAVMGDGKKR